jgi:hypothetical protein
MCRQQLKPKMNPENADGLEPGWQKILKSFPPPPMEE